MANAVARHSRAKYPLSPSEVTEPAYVPACLSGACLARQEAAAKSWHERWRRPDDFARS